jgi:hypothetical protein
MPTPSNEDTEVGYWGVEIKPLGAKINLKCIYDDPVCILQKTQFSSIRKVSLGFLVEYCTQYIHKLCEEKGDFQSKA